MKRYKQKVRAAAERRDGAPLYNGSLSHAAVLAEEMFANANSNVSIFSGSLNARVYGTSDIVEKARQFLSDTTHKVRVLIEEPDLVDAEDHLFVREFCDNNDVEFRSLSKDLKGKVDYHFIVMDDDSYRFEGDKSAPAAIAAFGDSAGAERLSEIFDTLWNVSSTEKFN